MKDKLDKPFPLVEGRTPPSTPLTYKDKPCRCGKLDRNNPQTYEREDLDMGEMGRSWGVSNLISFRCSKCKKMAVLIYEGKKENDKR